MSVFKKRLIFYSAILAMLLQPVSALALTDSQVQNARNLLQPNMFLDNNKTYSKDFHPPNNCHVKVTETVQLTNVEVGNLEAKLYYYCHRPDHRYKCGGGSWTTPQRAHYQGYILANLYANNGSLGITGIKNNITSGESHEAETDCSELLTDFLISKSGLYIGN